MLRYSAKSRAISRVSTDSLIQGSLEWTNWTRWTPIPYRLMVGMKAYMTACLTLILDLIPSLCLNSFLDFFVSLSKNQVTLKNLSQKKLFLKSALKAQLHISCSWAYPMISKSAWTYAFWLKDVLEFSLLILYSDSGKFRLYLISKDLLSEFYN